MVLGRARLQPCRQEPLTIRALAPEGRTVCSKDICGNSSRMWHHSPFHKIRQREVSFGRSGGRSLMDAANNSHVRPISAPFYTDFHLRATCIPLLKFRIIMNETNRRVSLQPRRSAAHPPAHSSPASDLGEGGIGDGRRGLFLLRSRANQESARPLRPARSPSRDPAVA